MRVRPDSVRVLGVLACLIAGCTGPAPTVPGLSVTASSADVTVTATDPDTASQDTTLDVVITGSNFDPGSEAQWAIAGVPSAKVHTNSTRFVNSRRLIASITIAVDADPVLYDVLVTTPGGKKGIGTELFAVRVKATPVESPLFVMLRDGVDDRVRSDGRGAYADAACGVSAVVNTSDRTAYLDPDRYRITRPQAAGCGGMSPRFVELRFVDLVSGPNVPASLQTGGILTVSDVLSIAVGGTEQRKARVNNVKCGLLGFNGEGGSSLATVTRVDVQTWIARAQAPADLGYCRNEGSLWRMPFEVTITLK